MKNEYLKIDDEKLQALYEKVIAVGKDSGLLPYQWAGMLDLFIRSLEIDYGFTLIGSKKVNEEEYKAAQEKATPPRAIEWGKRTLDCEEEDKH